MMDSKKTPEQRFLDAKIALIMGAPDNEIDEILIAAGFEPKDLEQRGKTAIRQALEAFQEDTDFISSLSLSKKKEIVKQLGIRHSVLAALAERRAIFESIPQRFVRALAKIIEISPDAMMQSLRGPVRIVTAPHKSDVAPTLPSQVLFEKLLKDAAMSDEEIRNVMREES